MAYRNEAVVAYVASPHQGYVEFFRAYEGAVLYVLGKDIVEQFQPLVRNLPALAPRTIRSMVRTLGIFSDVRILSEANIAELRKASRLILPDEDVSHAVAEKYFSECDVAFDGRWKLRWHKDAALAGRRPEGEVLISTEVRDQMLMHEARVAADRSSDWWRQVGALLAKDGKVLLVAFNKHLPSEQSAYLQGDPRSNFGPGESIDVSLALHAEIGIISEAARQGISTEGCDLYVTTFPCPPCARACANSGIKRLFYADGYSLVDGAEALKSRGVEIIRVDTTLTPSP